MFCHIKDEFFRDRTWPSFEPFRRDLEAYVVHWNTRRRQVKLKELTPEEFRNQSLAAKVLIYPLQVLGRSSCGRAFSSLRKGSLRDLPAKSERNSVQSTNSTDGYPSVCCNAKTLAVRKSASYPVDVFPDVLPNPPAENPAQTRDLLCTQLMRGSPMATPHLNAMVDGDTHATTMNRRCNEGIFVRVRERELSPLPLSICLPT